MQKAGMLNKKKCDIRDAEFDRSVFVLDLGVILLWCLFILCITRASEGTFRALHMQVGGGAALSLLLLAANACVVELYAELTVNPASLLICACIGVSALRHDRPTRMIQATALAVLASVLMTALHYLHLSERTHLTEPGLFIALCGIPFALLLYKTPGAALFLTVLSPVFMNLLEACMDLYSFGYAAVRLGSQAAFDAQIAGMMLTGIMISLFSKRTLKENRTRA